MMFSKNSIIETHNQIHYVWLYKQWVKDDRLTVSIKTVKPYFLEGSIAIAIEGPTHQIQI